MINSNNHKIGDINGDGNTIVNGDQTIIQAPKPKEGIMCNLLNNIANMIANREIHPELPDNLIYTIIDKIYFNNINVYLIDEDYFEEGLYIVENRLRTIEDSAIGNIKQQIFRYVQGFYISAKMSDPKLTADEIINLTEKSIISELKEHYFQILTPEDLGHVRFVVYYVFASCRIFLKPTKDFMMTKNANSQ
ncbi:hypothetical protein [Acinetobacter sp.]|uniref:hypothetical protein n=1 Tax=Acinetobacter sp. TaxID=472 RepID=UPI003340FE1A